MGIGNCRLGEPGKRLGDMEYLENLKNLENLKTWRTWRLGLSRKASDLAKIEDR